jgi:hypothetical protein
MDTTTLLIIILLILVLFGGGYYGPRSLVVITGLLGASRAEGTCFPQDDRRLHHV